MSDDKLISCYVELKKPPKQLDMVKIWNNVKALKYDNIQDDISKKFYKLVNKVVELGGVISIEPKKLGHEVIYVNYIVPIIISNDKLSEIRELDCVETIGAITYL